ncbi:acyl carrier protein [Pseudomonas sp. AM4(2022)]|uniref:acyl carrier protein n=1 Tax=Pseudomonas sp. AM4(2022) TaxID=2983408 RepID=UPI002E8092C1|nr:acyl carrier protein [Pseudomonas sp. AM4(2022)]
MNNPLDLNSVITTTQEILAQLLVMDIADVNEHSSILEDLGADSLDIVDLSFQLGRHYGCTLPKTSVLDHAVAVLGDVGDLVEKGRITPAGVELLEHSLSAFAPKQLRSGMQPAEIFAATTVRNWATQCYRMFDYLPTTCPECEADLACLNDRRQVVCCGCSARLTPMEGDEISRHLVEQFAASRLPKVV